MRGKGEGSVYKRKQDGMWCVSLELPPLEGKRRRKVLVAKTKQDVLTKLNTVKVELERAGDLPTASQTLESWLTYWVDKVAAKRLRPSTLYTYRRQLEAQVIPTLGKVRLDKLTPSHIRRLHDRMAADGLTSTYALTTHRVLSKALTDAMRDGRVSRNVATLVDAPKVGRNDSEPLDVDEAIEVFRYATEALKADNYDPTAVLWTAYLLTGIRRSELLALEWDRVTDEIDLSWQLTRIKALDTAAPNFEYKHLTGKLYLTRPKTNAGYRVIPLVDPLKSILDAHRQRSQPNKYGLVFARADGQPIEPGKATQAWRLWYKSVGLTEKHVVLHGLRHTAVDLLYAAGIPEDIIQEIVGHSTRAQSRAYKAKGNRGRLTVAMNQLSASLEPAPSGESRQ